MSEVIRTIVNTQTGEVTIQPLTAEEIAEVQAAESARLAEKAELDAAEAAKVAAKASAQAKLAALGLTESEISALLGA
jgi:hypothetical protein